MADTNTRDAHEPESRGFPFFTAAVTLVILFVFLGLTVIAYNAPSAFDEKKEEGGAKADPAAKLAEIRAKNRAALDGDGAKMSVAAATAELLDRAKQDGKLPFPVEPPPPPPEEPKKKPEEAKKKP
jgi:hypothetical protein